MCGHRGICGQLRLQTTLESILHQQLEDYIMQKTGSLEVFLKVCLFWSFACVMCTSSYRITSHAVQPFLLLLVVHIIQAKRT